MPGNVFYGQKLKMLRNFHGFSQEETGNFVNVSKQYIQQLESDNKKPSNDLINSFAKIFNVLPHFFLLSSAAIITYDQCHFRKLKAIPIGMKNRAIAHGSLFNLVLTELDKLLDLPSVDYPSHSPTHINDIENIAEYCREYWGLGITGPITNMMRVVENAGIPVIHFKNVSEKIDAFSTHCKRSFIIRNPNKKSTYRTRFDIAHECGHIIMHGGLKTGDKKTEGEANRFASAFLIPRAEFINEYPKTDSKRIPWQTIRQMKIHWKVSTGAIVKRAYDLKVMDDEQYKRANIHLSKTGQMRSEKDNDLIPKEHPELMHNTFSLLEQQAPELIFQLLRELGLQKKILEQLVDKKINLPIFDDRENAKIIELEAHRKK